MCIRDSTHTHTHTHTHTSPERTHRYQDRPGVRQIPEGSGEQVKMDETGCKIICGAPTTLAVKGLMVMMMMNFTQIGVRADAGVDGVVGDGDGDGPV